MLVSFVVVGLSATGCGGDDDGETPAPMNTGCRTGEVRTCFDSSRSCSGRNVCTSSGVFGNCICDVPPVNDGSVMGDGSIMSDGSTPDDASMDGDAATTEDASMGDGSMGEPDASPDADAPDQCAGSCVPEAPADFEGPYLTFIGGNDAPSCGGAYDEEGPTGSAGLVAPAADCSSCTCESTSNSCATYLNVTAGGNATCGGDTCSNTFDATCAELDFACIGDSETSTSVLASVPPSAGPCAPSAQTPEIDPPSFAQRAHTCAPDTALARNGCEAEELCAPSGPFDGAYCVTREGTHDCPSGPYSERHVFYGGVEDTRGCSECECDRDCEYTVELFPDADDTCGGTPAATLSIESPTATAQASSCEDAPVGPGGTLRAAFTVSGSGACSPSGGEPEGAAMGDDPITFCCLD